jgi:hypothetical protein
VSRALLRRATLLWGPLNPPLARPLLALLPLLLLGCQSLADDARPESLAATAEARIYFIDRINFAGGDNGFAVPLATCDEGTLFAMFGSRHRLETEPMSRMTAVDTGEGPLPLWSVEAPDIPPQFKWPGGHRPHLTCYPIEIEPFPLFVDDGPTGSVPAARLEAHERPSYRDGKHFPRLEWAVHSLDLGQGGGVLRRDQAEGQRNHGDSSVPRFAILADGRLAFLTQEIFRHGGGASDRVYRQLLEEAKKRDPSVRWIEVRADALVGTAPTGE